MWNADFTVGEGYGAVDLGLQELGRRFAFAGEVPYFLTVSRTVCFCHNRISMSLIDFDRAQAALNPGSADLLSKVCGF
jgi:hypothetical protein